MVMDVEVLAVDLVVEREGAVVVVAELVALSQPRRPGNSCVL